MGSTRSIYERKHTDTIYNLVVSGYLRHIHHTKKVKGASPTTNACDDKLQLKLVKLCLAFYATQMNEHLIIWSGTQPDGNAKCNGLSLIKFAHYGLNNCKAHQIYKLNIHNLDDNNFCNVEWNVNFDRSNSSYCMLSNINISQMKWITNRNLSASTFHPNTRYDMICRIGGNEEYCNSHKSRIDMTIFAPNPNRERPHMHLIEAYYSSEIQTFPRMPFISNTTVTSTSAQSRIFGYGGTLRSGNIWNNIYSVDINTLQYKRYSKLSQPKHGVTLTFGGYKRGDLFILGGNNRRCEVLKANNIIQSQQNMNYDTCLCTGISDLNMNRMFCGSTYFHNHENKIAVGGGGSHHDAMYSIEICDLNQNKWSVLQCKTNKMHCKYPLIWNDDINGNIVYLAGNRTRNDVVKNLGFIEWCDIRENRKKFNVLFYNEPINHLFGLTKKLNTDKLNWISRALII